PLEKCGRYNYSIEAWTDRFATWQAVLKKRVDAGLNVKSELAEGAMLISEAQSRAKAEDKTHLERVMWKMSSSSNGQKTAIELSLGSELADVMRHLDDRLDAVIFEETEIMSDRP